MTAVDHPEGCRCPGCLPGQYVMRPAGSGDRPSRPAREGNPAGNGGPIILIGLIVLSVGAFVFCWPALKWHGEGGPAGTSWRWDGATTVACSVWWAFLAFCVAGWRLTKTERWARWSEIANTAPAPPVPPLPSQPPLPCAHRDAVRVESALDGNKTLAWWCPSCETQLDPGFRASELRPDGSWPPVRKPPAR